MNRFEKKKNVKLAIEAFAILKRKLDATASPTMVQDIRLVLAGNLRIVPVNTKADRFSQAVTTRGWKTTGQRYSPSYPLPSRTT